MLCHLLIYPSTSKMLFKVEPRVACLLPPSFANASIIASKILRSSYHIKILCEMHKDHNGECHIEEATLTKFLARDEMFYIDKIRHLNQLNARAATIRNYDAFKIYFNPLLLLEMTDREHEENEIKLKPINTWPDLLEPLDGPYFDKGTKEPIRKHHNSLVYCHQSHTTCPPKAKSAKNSNKSTPAGPAAIVPTDMSVFEKDTLMQAILLVHEGDHLLNGLFSSVLINKETPPKKMRPMDSQPFSDIGHMVELQMYGWVIQHGYDDALPAPFAIQEILGAYHTAAGMDKFVLKPTAKMREFIANPAASPAIDSALLQLTPTSDAVFVQSSVAVAIGRKSSCEHDNTVMPAATPTAEPAAVPELAQYKSVFDTWKE